MPHTTEGAVIIALCDALTPRATPPLEQQSHKCEDRCQCGHTSGRSYLRDGSYLWGEICAYAETNKKMISAAWLSIRVNVVVNAAIPNSEISV